MPLIVALISAIALFILALILFLSHDLSKWRKDYTPVNHGWKTVLKRVLFLLPAAVLFSLYAKNWLSFPVAYIMMMAVWWEFFDGIYNISRTMPSSTKKFPWRYNGSFNDPGHTDAGTDGFLKNMKPWQQALLKWGLIAASIFGYILTIK